MSKSRIEFKRSPETLTRKILLERVIDWNEEGNHIQQLYENYNWEYRKKICVNCSLDTQKKLNCFRTNVYKDGIQETICKKLIKARSNKFRKTVLKFIEFHPSR